MLNKPISMLVMSICVVFSMTIAAAELVEGSRGALGGGMGIERGLARIMCRGNGPRSWFRSRVFVVDAGIREPAHDLLLTTAHSIPTDLQSIRRDCLIVGTKDSPVKIADVWLPSQARQSRGRDWALLMTETPLTGNVGRFRLGLVQQDSLQKLLLDEAPIRIVLNMNQADVECRMLGREWVSSDFVEVGVFANSCRSMPGMSGAPIVIRYGQRDVVIGIHQGQAWRPFYLDGPLLMGIGKVIDERIVAAIQAATVRIGEAQALQ